MTGFLLCLAIGWGGAQFLHTRRDAPLCQAAPPPKTLSRATPEWQIAPNMYIWKHDPRSLPYPSTSFSYPVKLTNAGTEPARNVHVFLFTEIFGWKEMSFVYPKQPNQCPVLEPGASNLWSWGHSWSEAEDPAWRPSMERTARLRFVWEDRTGWHEYETRLPSQYSPATFRTAELSVQ